MSSPQLKFVDRPSTSPLKELQTKRKNFPLRSGFGSTNDRFDGGVDKNPGVGAYEIDRSFIIRTPSDSKKGNYASKTKRQSFLGNDQGVPSPMHYKVASFDMSNAKNAVPFSPSGMSKGKVPWPDPLPIPGPAAYKTKAAGQYGYSPFVVDKKSASFCSTTGRNSFFDQQSPAPGPAKYDILGQTFEGKHDLEWSRSTGIRFENMGPNNGVPPPTRYFDEANDLVRAKSRDSLRTSGDFSGKLKGKQNERPSATIHTFGADKDRFKNSTYGRLDLAALIPAPGHYDNIFRYSINGGKGRAQTADPTMKKSKSLRRHVVSAPRSNSIEGKSTYLDFDSDYY